MSDLRDVALANFAQGYIPIRVEPGSKAPSAKIWQHVRPTEESIRKAFGRPSCLGIRTGDEHCNGTFLAAIDLDVDDTDLVSIVEEAIGCKVPCKRGGRAILGSSVSIANVKHTRFTSIEAVRKPR